MKDYISNISSFYEKKDNITLYNEWVHCNSSIYMRYFTLIALAITSLLIPFDFLLYDSPSIYSSVRVIMLIVYIVLLLCIFKFQILLAFEIQ